MDYSLKETAEKLHCKMPALCMWLKSHQDQLPMPRYLPINTEKHYLMPVTTMKLEARLRD